MSLSEVMLKTLIPSNFLDSDDEEIKSLTCPPETDDLQRNEFHMFNDYFGLSNLVQRVRQANNDFDYFTGEEFGVSKLQPRRDRFDSIDSENSSSGSCDSFTDHFGDGPFQPFTSSSLLHSAASKRKEAVVPPSRRIKPSARAPAPAISNRGTVCVFCRNNGESEEVYLSHLLKGPDGKTTCPILRAYTCPICKASGDESHTIKYCPQNQQAQANGGQFPKVPRNNRILPKRSR